MLKDCGERKREICGDTFYGLEGVFAFGDVQASFALTVAKSVVDMFLLQEKGDYIGSGKGGSEMEGSCA